MNKSGYQNIYTVNLGDTSAYGNTYYLTYHRWVAQTKEHFFLDNVSNFSDLFHKDGMKMFVLQSSLRILGETKLHEKITVDVVCDLIKKIKVHLVFRCFNAAGKQVAESENTIAFLGHDNKLIPIPAQVREALEIIRLR